MPLLSVLDCHSFGEQLFKLVVEVCPLHLNDTTAYRVKCDHIVVKICGYPHLSFMIEFNVRYSLYLFLSNFQLVDSIVSQAMDVAIVIDIYLGRHTIPSLLLQNQD